MRFSGFSFKLGKARLYFSNNKKTSAKSEAPIQNATPAVNTAQPTLAGVIFRVFLLFIAAWWVSQAWWRGDLLPFVVTVLLFLGAGWLFVDYLIFAPRRTAEAQFELEQQRRKAEEARREQEEQRHLEKKREAEMKKAAEPIGHVFIPGILLDSERQEFLKQLRLDYIDAVCKGSYKADISINCDDAAQAVTFLWNNQIVGIANEADTKYIIENLDNITLSGMEIDGGGHDYLGNSRPYYVSVFTALSPGSPEPPQTVEPVLAKQLKVWGAYDNAPCYISSTGKAHLAWGECKFNKYTSAPMTVYDAEKAGYTPCAHCLG